jgi:hypothetical protein
MSDASPADDTEAPRPAPRLLFGGWATLIVGLILLILMVLMVPTVAPEQIVTRATTETAPSETTAP